MVNPPHIPERKTQKYFIYFENTPYITADIYN